MWGGCRLRPALRVGVVAGLCLTAGGALVAQDAAEADHEPVRGPRDAVELEEFLDGYMAGVQASSPFAGAVVAAVRDGDVLLTKGYGYADVEQRRGVDPERTLFRIGSISKLFVWTAVLQMVEQGRLDLDTDVNRYLTDLEVPEYRGEPVTMAHLMSHTAGFEDRVVGLFAHDASRLRPLGEILHDELPERVRPPGDLAAYSNHGTGLAMYVVEQVSGVPWNEYLEERILRPLGMRHTTFRQPVPEELAPDLSQGYRFAGGELVAQEFEFVPLAPVGAASASATDMARFMITHLQLGRWGNRRLLEERTARRMQSPLHRHAEAVNPMAHGFIDMSRNGERVIGHGGDTGWFHSELALFPEHGLGLFVSMNTEGARPSSLYEAFVDHYFPRAESEPVDEGAAEALDLERYTGLFRSIRFDHTQLAKVGALAGSLPITADAERHELITGGQRAVHWRPSADPLVFDEAAGDRRLVFRERDDGAITHVFRSDLPIVAFERVPLSEHPTVHLVLLVAATGTFLLTVLVLPAIQLMRRHYRAQADRERRLDGGKLLLIWVLAAVLLLFVLGMTVVLSNPFEIAFGAPPLLLALLALPLIGAALAVAAAVVAVRIWRRDRLPLLSRMAFAWVVCVAWLFLWQLWTWNFIGWQL